MNKSYSKPSTTLQPMKLEGSFMNCSVRGKMAIEFEDYKTFEGFDSTTPSRVLDDGSWSIGFDD